MNKYMSNKNAFDGKWWRRRRSFSIEQSIFLVQHNGHMEVIDLQSKTIYSFHLVTPNAYVEAYAYVYWAPSPILFFLSLFYRICVSRTMANMRIDRVVLSYWTKWKTIFFLLLSSYIDIYFRRRPYCYVLICVDKVCGGRVESDCRYFYIVTCFSHCTQMAHFRLLG